MSGQNDPDSKTAGTDDPNPETKEKDKQGSVPEKADSVLDLMQLVIESDNLLPNDKIRIINEIRKARPPLQDRWLFRTVVWFLGLAALTTVVMGFILWDTTKGSPPLPNGLIALGSAALGALAGLLAPSSRSSGT